MKKAVSSAPRKLEVWRLGLMHYDKALALQTYLVEDHLLGRKPDILLSVQHPPTITLGRNRLTHTVLTPPAELHRLGIQVYYTERGGDATVHAPGQAVLYPIVSLRKLNLGLRKFVEGLEDTMLNVTREFGIECEGRIPYQAGVWIEKKRKIGSVGLSVSGGVTSHGLAYNVNPDLSYYSHIVPCGLVGKEVTSLVKELGSDDKVDGEEVGEKLIKNFVEIMGYKRTENKNINRETIEGSLERLVLLRGGKREWIKKADEMGCFVPFIQPRGGQGRRG